MIRFWLMLILTMLAFNIFAQKDIVLNESLIIEILNKNYDSVEILLKKGADPNYENVYGITPFMYAVETGVYDIVKLLIEKGAEINKVPKYALPPLSVAVINGSDSIVELLLMNKADPEIVDYQGNSPLYYAIVNKNYSALELLLLYGADPNKLINDWLPLQIAAYFNDTIATNILLYYQANPNLTDSKGFTPLHVAAQTNSLDVTKLLMQADANPKIKNFQYLLPIDLAVATRSNKTFDFLLDTSKLINKQAFGKYTTNFLALNEQNYFALKRLQSMDKQKLPTVFNMILGVSFITNNSDLMTGPFIGLKEIKYNFDLSLELYTRLTPKRVIFQQDENLYYQFWEQRFVINASAVKNFYLATFEKSNFYLFLGASYTYTNASYSGTTYHDTKISYQPKIGFSIDYYKIYFNFSFFTLKNSAVNIPNWYVNFSVLYRISPYSFDIKQKRLINIFYE